MSLFPDSKEVEVDTNTFISDIRSNIEAETEVKAHEYNFDFYRDRPLKLFDDTKPVHYQWVQGDWEEEIGGRVSDASESTSFTGRMGWVARGGGEDEEDLEEGETAMVPATVIRRRPSD